MLGDTRFYLVMFTLLVPPSFFTALFFHQASLTEWKGWDIQLMAAAFIAFGLCRAVVSFLVGPMVDRLTARKIYPINLIPLGLGLLCFIFGKEEFWSFFYLGLAGMTMGLSMTVSSALFAEFYGTKHLGSIKGFTSSLIVLATAIAPVAMGALLDLGIAPAKLLGAMGLILAGGVVSANVGCRYPGAVRHQDLN